MTDVATPASFTERHRSSRTSADAGEEYRTTTHNTATDGGLTLNRALNDGGLTLNRNIKRVDKDSSKGPPTTLVLRRSVSPPPSRPCPECGETLEYSSVKERNRAEKKHLLCRSCQRKNDRLFRSAASYRPLADLERRAALFAFYKSTQAPLVPLSDLIRLLVTRDLYEWQAAMNNVSLEDWRRARIAQAYLRACVERDNTARTALNLDDQNAGLCRLLFATYFTKEPR